MILCPFHLEITILFLQLRSLGLTIIIPLSTVVLSVLILISFKVEMPRTLKN